MSKIEVDEVVNQTGDNDSGLDLSTNDEVKIKTANTNHFVIDSSGNMGLGTTSVNNIGASNRVLEINGAGLSPWIHFTNNTSGTGANDGTLIGTEGVDTYILNRENGTTRFHTNNTELMRIDADALRVGNTSGSWPSVDGCIISKNGIFQAAVNSSSSLYLNRGSTNGNVAQFSRSGTIVGGISVTTSAVSFNTSSDYRLKENVVTDWDATTRLKQLKPSRFNFIEDADVTVDGFLAHEVSNIVPEAIIGTKDEVHKEDDTISGAKKGDAIYQSIDQSKLVPLLTKALQEAMARIETLEAKVTALEGK